MIPMHSILLSLIFFPLFQTKGCPSCKDGNEIHEELNSELDTAFQTGNRAIRPEPGLVLLDTPQRIACSKTEKSNWSYTNTLPVLTRRSAINMSKDSSSSRQVSVTEQSPPNHSNTNRWDPKYTLSWRRMMSPYSD